MDKTINWLSDNKNEFCVNNKTNVMVSQDNGKLNTCNSCCDSDCRILGIGSANLFFFRFGFGIQ
jgi:hypothetical protein